MISLRNMKPGDIPAGLSLCRAAGWNQLSRDWEMFLDANPRGCFVAEEDQVAGTVTTIRYQDHFSWIGMLLVDPAMRRRGIGMRLFEKSLEFLKDDETVKLDATPAGRELYLKMNFVDEYNLTRMVLEKSPGEFKTEGIRTLGLNDLELISPVDEHVFDADRSLLLKWLSEGAPQLALISDRNPELPGYCFGRPGFNFMQIGPVIAPERKLAEALVSGALNVCKGMRVVIDIPEFDIEWKQWLVRTGFSVQRPFIRMYRGSNKFHGLPENMYGILGPEFG